MSDTKRGGSRGPTRSDQPRRLPKAERFQSTLEEVALSELSWPGEVVVLEKGKRYVVDKVLGGIVLVPRESVLTVNVEIADDIDLIIVEDISGLTLGDGCKFPPRKFREIVDSIDEYLGTSPESKLAEGTADGDQKGPGDATTETDPGATTSGEKGPAESDPERQVGDAVQQGVRQVDATGGDFVAETRQAGRDAGADVAPIVRDADDATARAKEAITDVAASAVSAKPVSPPPPEVSTTDVGGVITPDKSGFLGGIMASAVNPETPDAPEAAAENNPSPSELGPGVEAPPPPSLPLAERREPDASPDPAPESAPNTGGESAAADAAPEGLKVEDFHAGERVTWKHDGEDEVGEVVGTKQITIGKGKRAKDVLAVEVALIRRGRRTNTTLSFMPDKLTKLPPEAKAEDFIVGSGVGWISGRGHQETGRVVEIASGKVMVQKIGKGGKEVGKPIPKKPGELTSLQPREKSQQPAKIVDREIASRVEEAEQKTPAELALMKGEIDGLSDRKGRVIDLMATTIKDDRQVPINRLFYEAIERYSDNPDDPATIVAVYHILLERVIPQLEALVAEIDASTREPAPEPGNPGPKPGEIEPKPAKPGVGPEASMPLDSEVARRQISEFVGQIQLNIKEIRERAAADLASGEISEDIKAEIYKDCEMLFLTVEEISDLVVAGSLGDAFEKAKDSAGLSRKRKEGYTDYVGTFKAQEAREISRARALSGRVAENIQKIKTLIGKARKEGKIDNQRHDQELARWNLSEGVIKDVENFIESGHVTRALSLAQEWLDITSDRLGKLQEEFESAPAEGGPETPPPETPPDTELAEKRTRAEQFIANIRANAQRIRDMAESARGKIAQDMHDSMLHWAQKYDEAAAEAAELIAVGNVAEALATAEPAALSSESSVQNYPAVIAEWEVAFAAAGEGSHSDGEAREPDVDSEPIRLSAAAVAGAASSALEPFDDGGEPAPSDRDSGPRRSALINLAEAEALAAELERADGEPTDSTPMAVVTVRQLLNEAQLVRQLAGGEEFTMHEARSAEYQAQFTDVDHARRLAGAAVREIFRLNNSTPETVVIGGVEVVAVDDSPADEIVEQLCRDTGLTHREVLEIFYRSRQDEMIRDLAISNVGSKKSRGRRWVEIGARVGVYSALGIGSALAVPIAAPVLGLAVGTLGVASGGVIALTRLGDRFFTDKKTAKAVATEEAKIRGRLARGEVDEGLIRGATDRLAALQQRRIDGSPEVDIRRFIEINAGDLGVENDNQREALIGAMEALRASDKKSAEMAQGGWYEKIAENPFVQWVDRVVLGGGRTNEERTAVTAAFGILGTVGRQTQSVRRVLMGVAGWRLGDVLGKLALKDKRQEQIERLGEADILRAEEALKGLTTLNERDEKAIFKVVNKKNARLILRVAGAAVGVMFPELVAAVMGHHEASAQAGPDLDKLFADRPAESVEHTKGILSVLHEKDPAGYTKLMENLSHAQNSDQAAEMVNQAGSDYLATHQLGATGAGVNPVGSEVSPQVEGDAVSQLQHIHDGVADRWFPGFDPEHQEKLDGMLSSFKKNFSHDYALLEAQLEDRGLNPNQRLELVDNFQQAHEHVAPATGATAGAEAATTAGASGSGRLPGGTQLNDTLAEPTKLGVRGAGKALESYQSQGEHLVSPLHDTMAEGQAPVTLDAEQLDLATIHKGEGIEHALNRQLVNEPARFGFHGDVHDVSAVRAWAGGEAHRLAIRAGFVDATTGQEIRVGSAGIDQAKYLIEGDAKSGIRVHELLGGQDKGVHAAAADFQSAKFEGGAGKQDFEYVQGGHGDTAHAVASAHQEAGTATAAHAAEAPVSGVATETPSAQPEWISDVKVANELQSHLDLSNEEARFALLDASQQRLVQEFGTINDQFGHPFELFGIDSNGDGKIDTVSALCDGKFAGRVDVHGGDIEGAIRVLENQCAHNVDVNLSQVAENLTLSKSQLIDLVTHAHTAGIDGFSPEAGVLPNSQFDRMLGALGHGEHLSILQHEDGTFDQGQLVVLKELMKTTADGHRLQPILETTKVLNWDTGAETGLAKVLLDPKDPTPLREVFGVAMVHGNTTTVFGNHKIIFEHVGAGAGERVAINFNDNRIHVGGSIFGGTKKFALDDLKGAIQHLAGLAHAGKK
ncbi:MAG: hypothetical protein WC516_03870 [Patescibacteria group bacterium]